MSIKQKIILAVLSIWALSMWGGYYYLAQKDDFFQNYTLSDDFWSWEAEGRIALIDNLVDDVDIIDFRQNGFQGREIELAMLLIAKQNAAYGMDDMDHPQLRFVSLRGDANGLYVPTERAIFLNKAMQWDSLPFERFASVILHENMHHILTQNDKGQDDFVYLAYAGYAHEGYALTHDNHDQHNPQEDVAYRAERAARFAGIDGADISTWEMTNRMQELKALQSR